MRSCFAPLFLIAVAALLLTVPSACAQEEHAGMRLTLRTQIKSSANPDEYQIQHQQQVWPDSRTAVIVCDVWDYHHCLNAVKRVQEFAPRLNQVLTELRRRGATIIHAPSDCMDSYRDHPARRRAIRAPSAVDAPPGMDGWCSSIPSEKPAVYPIDQSDGGEDDDPDEHANWVKQLVSLGRNPQAPWRRQTDLLTIDPAIDYISDRGDEVWNILQACNIEHVILVGVHTNMCVLGRPFGLRQMVRGGKHVVLMRDMTDTMYNPRQWPFVSHFEGTRRIIDHIERHVCPTISSDQIIGGNEFRFAGDRGERQPDGGPADPNRSWVPVAVPDKTSACNEAYHWYRCVVRVPRQWVGTAAELQIDDLADNQAWINGHTLTVDHRGRATVPVDRIEPNDANLLVIRCVAGTLDRAPAVVSGADRLVLAGRWQLRCGDDPAFQNMPLPAKFGAGSDIIFAPAPAKK